MRDAVLHPELDRADLQHLGAQRRELEHLLVADARRSCAPSGTTFGIGGVDAVDVGVDLADVGLERRRDRHGRRVGAAAPERRDVAVLVDALETGDDGDLPARSASWMASRVDVLDARAARTRCRSGSAPGARAASAPCRPRPGWPAPSRPTVTCSPVAATTSISRSSGRRVISLREAEQAVRLARHRRHHDDDVVPLLCVARPRRATLRMRSMVPTEVPPNFWTMSKAAESPLATSRPSRGGGHKPRAAAPPHALAPPRVSWRPMNAVNAVEVHITAPDRRPGRRPGAGPGRGAPRRLREHRGRRAVRVPLAETRSGRARRCCAS